MKKLSLISMLLFVGSSSFAAADLCSVKIRDVEYSRGGTDEEMASWRNEALAALNICAAKGRSGTVQLAALMQASCEKMTYKTNNKLGTCYLSAAKVIGLSF